MKKLQAKEAISISKENKDSEVWKAIDLAAHRGKETVTVDFMNVNLEKELINSGYNVRFRINSRNGKSYYQIDWSDADPINVGDRFILKTFEDEYVVAKLYVEEGGLRYNLVSIEGGLEFSRVRHYTLKSLWEEMQNVELWEQK